MSVSITVSEVRDAIYRAAGGASAVGGGAVSTALLGRWFHESLSQLVAVNSTSNAASALADVEPDLSTWKRALIEHVYSTSVGPRLTRHQAALHDVAPQVLSFWQALQAACDWLAELSWNVEPAPAARRAGKAAPWQTLSTWLATEEPLTCELREPGWSDSVRLVGVADAVLRPAGTSHWCAIEFKLGQTSPAADLGQACLYHLMLTCPAATGASNGIVEARESDAGTLALISFRPERHEQLFSADQLAAARQKLIELIGHLAGVAPANGTVPSDLLLLKQSPSAEHRELGGRLIETFREYGVVVSLDGDPIIGPTFLRFPLTLGRATKVAAVENRAAELQVRLGLAAAPFIQLDGGHLVVDVQRPDRQMVSFDQVRSQLPALDPRLGCSRVPLGVDLEGRLQFADFAKTEHAHLLVAGTTGSGKSEWLRLAVAGLMLTNTPATLRLLIIDPKRNAFHALRESPYLWKPIVFPDEQSASDVLRELADEMDRRYRMLDGADSLAELADRSDAALPRIVCVCDEYYDLINRSRAERVLIEAQVCRLGAKARAAGIHLILATQQPSRQTIKGPLDSNIPARIGLKMQKPLESQMLLSESGAERLLGYGDLLFRDLGPPRRLQAPLLSEENRDAIFGRR